MVIASLAALTGSSRNDSEARIEASLRAIGLERFLPGSSLSWRAFAFSSSARALSCRFEAVIVVVASCVCTGACTFVSGGFCCSVPRFALAVEGAPSVARRTVGRCIGVGVVATRVPRAAREAPGVASSYFAAICGLATFRNAYVVFVRSGSCRLRVFCDSEDVDVASTASLVRALRLAPRVEALAPVGTGLEAAATEVLSLLFLACGWEESRVTR